MPKRMPASRMVGPRFGSVVGAGIMVSVPALKGR